MSWIFGNFLSFWKNHNLKQFGTKPRRRPFVRRKPMARLEILTLEERVVPTASTLGTLSGLAFVAGPNNSQQAILPGVEVTLTGPNGNFTTTTDATGAFAFRSVQAGTYELNGVAGATFVAGGSVSGLAVVAG